MSAQMAGPKLPRSDTPKLLRSNSNCVRDEPRPSRRDLIGGTGGLAPIRYAETTMRQQ